MGSLDTGVRIKRVTRKDKKIINAVADVHLKTFKGFFLTFMGKGFLRQMYSSYVPHKYSDLLVALDGDKVVGFLAYSKDISGLYKYMLRHKFIQFVWYSLCAVIRKPKTFLRIFRAIFKSSETKREEKYVQLSSIGVLPEFEGKGVGGALISELVNDDGIKDCEYIALETDAENNDSVNEFYIKKGFKFAREFTTREGRKMNEYRYLL